MLDRLTKLQKTDGAFAVISKQMLTENAAKENQKQTSTYQVSVPVKLNKSEQIKVKSALESVETLKFKVKKQMATRRIVDLTK